LKEGRPRSRARIFADILTAIEAEGEAKPTRIMYRANMAYERLVKYLAEMEKSGLVKRISNGERVHYIVTEKGNYFLKEFRRLEDFTTAFGLKL
jgi:predicted transcriptional regulator